METAGGKWGRRGSGGVLTVAGESPAHEFPPRPLFPRTHTAPAPEAAPDQSDPFGFRNRILVYVEQYGHYFYIIVFIGSLSSPELGLGSVKFNSHFLWSVGMINPNVTLWGQVKIHT